MEQDFHTDNQYNTEITPEMEQDATPTVSFSKRKRNASTGAHSLRTIDAVAETKSSYRRTSSRYTARPRRTKKVLISLVVVLVILALLAAAAYGLARWIGLVGGSESEDDPTLISLTSSGKQANLPSVNVDTLISALGDLDAAEDEYVIFDPMDVDFSLDEDQTATLDAAIAAVQEAIENAYASYTTASSSDEEDAESEDAEGEDDEEGTDETTSALPATADFGFFAIDLVQGCGVAYNLDASVAGTDAIKALYATFFASQLLDTAKATESNEGDDVIEALSASGDATYEDLRETYDSYGWDAWITGIGATSYISSAGYYPEVTTRMNASAWLNVYRYLTGGTLGTTWLSDNLEATASSLTADAIATTRTISSTSGEIITIGALTTDAIVWSYGAYENDSSTETYCLVESAIILVDGHSYLICLASGLPDTSENEDVVKDLIAACAQAIIQIDTADEADEDSTDESEDGESDENEATTSEE